MKRIKTTLRVIRFFLLLPLFIISYLLFKRQVTATIKNKIIENKEDILKAIDRVRLKVRNM